MWETTVQKDLSLAKLKGLCMKTYIFKTLFKLPPVGTVCSLRSTMELPPPPPLSQARPGPDILEWLGRATQGNFGISEFPVCKPLCSNSCPWQIELSDKTEKAEPQFSTGWTTPRTTSPGRGCNTSGRYWKGAGGRLSGGQAVGSLTPLGRAPVFCWVSGLSSRKQAKKMTMTSIWS